MDIVEFCRETLDICGVSPRMILEYKDVRGSSLGETATTVDEYGNMSTEITIFPLRIEKYATEVKLTSKYVLDQVVRHEAAHYAHFLHLEPYILTRIAEITEQVKKLSALESYYPPKKITGMAYNEAHTAPNGPHGKVWRTFALKFGAAPRATFTPHYEI